MRTLTIFFVLALTFYGHWAAAQHPHGGATTQPVELHPGLGNYQHPITTKNADAQTHFNQGLILLYGFNHDEAARYFRRAAELDPEAAMPYWGLALAIGPNYNDTAVDENRAQSDIRRRRKALERAPKASAREQHYIRALAKRYPSANAKSDWKRFHLDYSNAMRSVVKKYPDDLDAATMFAESLMMLRPWQLWTRDGKPAPGTLELVAVLESVLKRNPDHPGANHFYIHAVEASHNLERAIPSAMRLMTLVPGAGHLVHMPGHIFLQTGDYELAAKTNVKRRGGGQGVRPAHGRDRRVSADVLDAQHSLHRVRARAAGAVRGGEAGGAGNGAKRRRRGCEDADARRLPSVSADGRSALPSLGRYSRDAGPRSERKLHARFPALRARDGAGRTGQGSSRRRRSRSSSSRCARRCRRNRSS